MNSTLTNKQSGFIVFSSFSKTLTDLPQICVPNYIAF